MTVKCFQTSPGETACSHVMVMTGASRDCIPAPRGVFPTVVSEKKKKKNIMGLSPTVNCYVPFSVIIEIFQNISFFFIS